jgi:hypothetical protein
MWLPALGAALFVAVALWWAVTPSAPPIGPDVEGAPSASADTVAVAAAAPPARAPQPIQTAMPMGGARPVPSGVHMDPRLEERMRKLHEGMDLKGTGKHP